MVRIQQFDFSMLESLAVNLLETSEPIRSRIRDQYRILLVDEAQDLNPTQYRLMEGIGLKSEVLVGDPQQSIYAFRQADRRLFKKRSAEFETVELSVNHRSDPGIQDTTPP